MNEEAEKEEPTEANITNTEWEEEEDKNEDYEVPAYLRRRTQ